MARGTCASVVPVVRTTKTISQSSVERSQARAREDGQLSSQPCTQQLQSRRRSVPARFLEDTTLRMLHIERTHFQGLLHRERDVVKPHQGEHSISVFALIQEQRREVMVKVRHCFRNICFRHKCGQPCRHFDGLLLPLLQETGLSQSKVQAPVQRQGGVFSARPYIDIADGCHVRA
jgi:hypothetical protein